MKRCQICGRTAAVQRLVLIRTAEIDADGEISFPQREVCPRCCGERAVLLPDATTRNAVQQTLARVHQHLANQFLGIN